MEEAAQAAAAKQQLAGMRCPLVVFVCVWFTCLVFSAYTRLTRYPQTQHNTHNTTQTAALGLIKPPSTAPSSSTDDNNTDSSNNKDQLLKSLLSPTSDNNSGASSAMELDAEGAALPMLLELAKGQRILARALAALPPQQVRGRRRGDLWWCGV